MRVTVVYGLMCWVGFRRGQTSHLPRKVMPNQWVMPGIDLEVLYACEGNESVHSMFSESRQTK